MRHAWVFSSSRRLYRNRSADSDRNGARHGARPALLGALRAGPAKCALRSISLRARPTATTPCLIAAGDDCIAARRCGRAAPSRPFSAGPYGIAVKDLAGPVTIPTTDRRLGLRSGVDRRRQLPLPRAQQSTPRPLFTGALRAVLAASPRNVHYFFGWIADQAAFNNAKARWLTELQLLPPADRDHWVTHVHFVTTRLDQVHGLDRHHAPRPRRCSGALHHRRRSPPSRSIATNAFARSACSAASSAAAPSARAPDAANEARAFNFEFDRETRLAAQQRRRRHPRHRADRARHHRRRRHPPRPHPLRHARGRSHPRLPADTSPPTAARGTISRTFACASPPPALTAARPGTATRSSPAGSPRTGVKAAGSPTSPRSSPRLAPVGTKHFRWTASGQFSPAQHRLHHLALAPLHRGQSRNEADFHHSAVDRLQL